MFSYLKRIAQKVLDMLNPERVERLKKLDPNDHLVYVCQGCGNLFPELIAEGVHDLECPHCEQPLNVDDY